MNAKQIHDQSMHDGNAIIARKLQESRKTSPTAEQISAHHLSAGNAIVKRKLAAPVHKAAPVHMPKQAAPRIDLETVRQIVRQAAQEVAQSGKPTARAYSTPTRHNFTVHRILNRNAFAG